MFEIRVNADDLDLLEADLQARLQGAFQVALPYIVSVWQAAVSGLTLPGMRRSIRDARYAAMVTDPSAIEYPFNGDAFKGRVVMLDDGLARRYEEGYASFDMKPGLLAGPHARHTQAGGRYTVVPLVHSIPTAAGQKGTPMPPDIYAMARRLGRGRGLRLPEGMQDYGRRSKVPAGVNQQATLRGRPGPMTEPYTWRASPYAGMVRRHRAGHSTYLTFRTVSDRSPAGSWIHPGQAPNPVILAVRDRVADEVVGLIRSTLAGG